MITEETIYGGNILSEDANNESENKKAIAKAWKPITIGGSAGIMLGTGAILMSSTQETFDSDDTPIEEPRVEGETQMAAPQETVTEEPVTTPMEQLPVATVDDNLPFGDAFASAREQVGPGGVFNWRSVIFSTYTSDEWNAMTEEEHQHFAQLVKPEVDAAHVNDADVYQSIAMAVVEDAHTDYIPVEDLPIEDAIDDLDLAQAVVEDNDVEEVDLSQVVVDDADMAQATIDEDAMEKIHEDMAAATEPSALGQQPDVEISAQDVVGEFDMAMADVAADDVSIVEESDTNPIEDIAMIDDNVADDEFALSDMFDLKPEQDIAMATPATKASQGGTPFENFLSDSTVRIVGYGEFDGHQVRGLDLDGDDRADIAVIDVDDSGDLSSADMVVEQGNGNQFTYGELQDFAMNQEHGDADDHNMHTPNPDIAEDMPDYMDDAMAQL